MEDIYCNLHLFTLIFICLQLTVKKCRRPLGAEENEEDEEETVVVVYSSLFHWFNQTTAFASDSLKGSPPSGARS